VLIFIHELGHFAVAKWLKVKVEKFSIGFGPSLFSRRIGETEYVLAALPLGGFVKMLGEVPGEELPPDEVSRAFNARPVWQRIAIALAGPVMNLTLPVFLIAAIVMAGIPTPTSRVADVAPGSAAAKAGIVVGDRIVAAGGESLWRWVDLQKKLEASGSPSLPVTVEKENGQHQDVTLEREKIESGDAWKDSGLSWSSPAALIGVADPKSPAAIAGLQSGDTIVAVSGVPVANLFALKRRLAEVNPPIEFEVERPLDGLTEKVHATVRTLAGERTIESLGVVPLSVSFGAVYASTPAKQAGLQPNDVVVRIGGELVSTSEQLRNAIWASEGKPVTLTVLRDKRFVEAKVTPAEGPQPTERGTETHFNIGVRLDPVAVGGEYKDDKVSNPLLALGRGVTRTGEVFAMIVGGIAQLVSGSVGMNSLSGPIGIADIASDAYKSSWSEFVWLMAVISVNLAILNLLPIPVLDGGQIVLAAAEGIKGSPLPARARDIAQTVGLSLILLLMGVAFWNDIARHWSGVMSFFTDLG